MLSVIMLYVVRAEFRNLVHYAESTVLSPPLQLVLPGFKGYQTVQAQALRRIH
jgi:hypothetical protein